LPSRLPEYVFPGILSLGEDDGDELLEFLFFRAEGTRRLRVTAFSRQLPQKLSWISAEQQGEHQHYDAAQTPDRYLSATDTSPIFNVLALSFISPTHFNTPRIETRSFKGAKRPSGRVTGQLFIH